MTTMDEYNEDLSRICNYIREHGPKFTDELLASGASAENIDRAIKWNDLAPAGGGWIPRSMAVESRNRHIASSLQPGIRPNPE